LRILLSIRNDSPSPNSLSVILSSAQNHAIPLTHDGISYEDCAEIVPIVIANEKITAIELLE